MKRSSQWETIPHDDILHYFSLLSEDEMGDITLSKQLFSVIHKSNRVLSGVFQLKRARSYVEERCSSSNETAVHYKKKLFS